MKTEWLTEIYRKAETAKGVSRNALPAVTASKTVVFDGWTLQLEISNTNGIEWHYARINWYNHHMIVVGGKTHQEVVSQLNLHLDRLRGLNNLSDFVRGLDQPYSPE